MADNGNFPPPNGLADQIIAKAIELLDADVWERETETIIVIRGVFFTHQAVTIPIHKDGSPILKEGAPSVAYGEAFKEAYKRAMARERDRRMSPLFRRLSSATLAARLRWMRRTWHVLKVSVPAIVGVAFITWAGVSIKSCAEQAAVRTNEVNKYGYKYGSIGSHKVWPDDCAGSGVYYPTTGKSRDFTSVSDCKETWERWERWEQDGEMWVDWRLTS